MCIKRRHECVVSSFEALTHGPTVFALPKIPTLARNRALLGTITLFEHYRKNRPIVVGFSAAPYDYTLVVWVTVAALVSLHGLPNTLAAFMFVGEAVLGFALSGPSPTATYGVVRLREGPRPPLGKLALRLCGALTALCSDIDPCCIYAPMDAY